MVMDSSPCRRPPAIPAGYFFSGGQINLPPQQTTAPTSCSSSSSSAQKSVLTHFSSLHYMLQEEDTLKPAGTRSYTPRTNPPLPAGVVSAILEAIAAKRVEIKVTDKSKEAGAGAVEGLIPRVCDYHQSFDEVISWTGEVIGGKSESPIPLDGQEERPPLPQVLQCANPIRPSVARAAAAGRGAGAPRGVASAKYSAAVEVEWTPPVAAEWELGELPPVEVVLRGVARSMERPLVCQPKQEARGEEGMMLVSAKENVTGFKKFVRVMRRTRKEMKRRRKETLSGKLRRMTT